MKDINLGTMGQALEMLILLADTVCDLTDEAEFVAVGFEILGRMVVFLHFLFFPLILGFEPRGDFPLSYIPIPFILRQNLTRLLRSLQSC